MDSNTAKPVLSSSVLVVRPKPENFEVLFIQRNPRSSFMGGMYAFPGGCVEEYDFGEHFKKEYPASTLPLLDARVSVGNRYALCISAVRELFEEAGILLARDERGKSLLEYNNSELPAIRRKILENRPLHEVIHAKGWRCTPDLLMPYAHWITPAARPKRFDTFFFVVTAGDTVTATKDAREISNVVWRTPAEALEDHSAGFINLSPPTLKMVHDLAGCSSLADLRKRTISPNLDPVIPVLLKQEKGAVIILPSDPDYDEGRQVVSRQGERPADLSDAPTRLVRNGTRWELYVVER